MATSRRALTILSSAEKANLKAAKAAMSAKYLGRQVAALGAGRAFRAIAADARTANASNVVGVGIDDKYVDGMSTGIKVVKFLVKTKLPKSSLTKSQLLPVSIDGIPTDIEEVGLIVPLAKKRRKKRTAVVTAAPPNPRARHRPAQPGCSVGFREPNNRFVMAGTFGAVVKDSGGKLYVLSNNHVLAFENGIDTTGQRRAALPVGAPIFQPGLLDGGSATSDQIAELSRWVDLRADRMNNKVDGAIALTRASIVSRDVLFIGTPQGKTAAAESMTVHKFGRTTSYRVGNVTSIAFDLSVPYEVGDVVFTDQIAIRGQGGRFSDQGDSGSTILERDSNKVIGLLFAGSTNGAFTFANHINDVLAKLKVKLA